MKKKFTIIGGGVAGLSAAIRLAELGEEPLLIEGGSYPSHKVCGEFLSPECLSILQRWEVQTIPIPEVIIRTPKTHFSFPFPSPAGGLSHFRLDPALAAYATRKGATIKTETQVTSFIPKDTPQGSHLITLSNGEVVQSCHTIIATGRIPSYSVAKPEIAYVGFKAHFKDLSSSGKLEMFSFPKAYLGLSPVEGNTYNVACLAKLEAVQRDKDPQSFINHLISSCPELCHRLTDSKKLFATWMTASVPDFGIKKTPDWLDTYFIGDASVTIPPASGSGLSMAIIGGCLAAEHAVRHLSKEFKHLWKKRCASQLFWAKLLHQLMLNPHYGNPFLRLSQHFPILCKKAFALTRQPALYPL
ncbi:Uncharacterized protein PHSC3_000709 [Chlamydiales bacterium STE3]|nr:Uncharacterized protein PHSC3_000709 [Chlamydiales bacterium STE3]